MKKTHLAMSKSRFKVVSKKRKRENISNVFKLEKEMKTHEKNLFCNIKIQV
jgi:hypothetical protein